MTAPPPTSSASALAAAIRRGELRSRDLLERYLDRIERLDGAIGAVVTLDVDRARAAADAADADAAAGRELGRLHGLPITVKDAIATEGIRSTGGAVELRDHVPSEDAPAVDRLKRAGAIVFGKTNLPRWSADMESFNELFGTTSNPWDTDRVPGGSSGGAGAAVAAGFTSFELGTDIGGSVRVPAHWNGVFGLKPTYGVIPQRGYLDHVGGGTIDVDINVFGPLARSADDLDLLLDVLAGPLDDDAVAWRLDLPPARPAARVALWLDDEHCALQADYRGAIDTCVDRLRADGVEVVESSPPVGLDTLWGLFSVMVSAAMALSRDADDAVLSHDRWLQASIARNEIKGHWAEWLRQFDAVLCPVTPSAATLHAQGEFGSRMMTIDGVERAFVENTIWTGSVGVLGLPAAVGPIGRTSDGLPVGVQCVAPWFRDRDCIALARRIGTYDVPPGFED